MDWAALQNRKPDGKSGRPPLRGEAAGGRERSREGSPVRAPSIPELPRTSPSGEASGRMRSLVGIVTQSRGKGKGVEELPERGKSRWEGLDLVSKWEWAGDASLSGGGVSLAVSMLAPRKV